MLGLLLQFMIAFQLRAALFLTLVCSSLAAPEETQGDQSAGGALGFFNSWFDKIFSWFGSFGSPFSTSVNIDVVEINNKSARYLNWNCLKGYLHLSSCLAWTAPGLAPALLTWAGQWRTRMSRSARASSSPSPGQTWARRRVMSSLSHVQDSLQEVQPVTRQGSQHGPVWARWDEISNVHKYRISAQVTKNLVVPGTEEGNIHDSSEETNSEEVEDEDDDDDDDDSEEDEED